MPKFLFYCFIIIFLNKKLTKCSKIWISPTYNLMNSTNWENGLPPCDQDKILFPENYPSALILSKDLVANSLVLPKEGALIFGDINTESVITITDKIEKNNDKNCKNKNNLAKFKFSSNSTKYWFDPLNWKNTLENINSATPDLEKIPCLYDTVIMPRNGSLSINFENIDTLDVNNIEMGGVNTTWMDFQNDIFSDLSHIIFKNADYINDLFSSHQSSNNLCSCHNPNYYSAYENKVCSHVKEHCENNYPKCLDPIKPYGHCCQICGAVLKIFFDDCSAFELEFFNKLIQNEIKKQGLERYLNYYVSIIHDDNNNYYAQLIISDKNDYNELSVNFMNYFNELISREGYQTNLKKMHLSGMKYDKNNPENPWKYVVLPLLFTILFFAFIYVYFVTGYTYLPSWLYQNRFGLFNSSFVFARFDNSQGEMEIAENLRPQIRIETLNTNPNETENEEILNANISSSFDNPMFEEKLEVPNSQNIENLSIASGSTELTMICLDDM